VKIETAKRLVPSLHRESGVEKSRSATPLDATTITLVAAPVSVIVAWLLQDLFMIPLPPNVAAAIGGLIGYVVARKFRH
jgi:hypothetical protein